MDKLLLKRTAIQSVALMIAVITVSYALRQYNEVTISASNIHSAEAASLQEAIMEESEQPEENPEGMIQTDSKPIEEENPVKEPNALPGMLEASDRSIISQLGDKLLIIKKPSMDELTMTLEDLYLTKSIRIMISSKQSNRMDSRSIGRLNTGDVFLGEPVFDETEESVINPEDGSVKTVITRDYGKDIVHGITLVFSEVDGYFNTELMMELDNVYAHIIMEDEQYYYIGLKKPSEVYERILVLDAGHGGKDAGALSRDEAVYEKNINVQLLLEVKELLDKENIKVYYTRLNDDKVFLRPRVELANAVDCDFFISIHCNASSSNKPNGTEILYYDTEFKQVSAKNLAKIFSEEIDLTTDLKNQGLVEHHSDDIFILNHATVPAVLIEAGYMTNGKDLSYLVQEDNQEAVALGIYNGILRAYEEYGTER